MALVLFKEFLYLLISQNILACSLTVDLGPGAERCNTETKATSLCSQFPVFNLDEYKHV